MRSHHRSWHTPSSSGTREFSWAGHEVSPTLLNAERQHDSRSGRASWLAALAIVAAVAVGATPAQQHDKSHMMNSPDSLLHAASSQPTTHKPKCRTCCQGTACVPAAGLAARLLGGALLRVALALARRALAAVAAGWAPHVITCDHGSYTMSQWHPLHSNSGLEDSSELQRLCNRALHGQCGCLLGQKLGERH